MNRVLQHFSKILSMVWLLFPAILFIILTALVFISLAQGQDVVLIAVQTRDSATLLTLAVTFLAFMSWYTSRLIVYIKTERQSLQLMEAGERETGLFWHDAFPRILGYATFFAVEAALINHPYFGTDNDGWWVLALLLVQAGIYYWVYRHFKNTGRNYKSGGTLLAIIALVIILALIFLLSANGTIQRNLWVQLVALWVAQTAFLIWNHLRRKHLDTTKTEEKTTITLLKKIKIITLPDNEVKFFKGFNALMLLPIGFYLAAIFSGDWARMVGPFNIAMLSFGVLLGFLQIVSMVTIWRRVNFHFLLWAIAIITGMFFSPYELRHEPTADKVYNQRNTLDTYAKQWFTNNYNEITDTTSTKKFPVYFVLSDGGASRSGYWVASALGRLESETGGKFSNHLFCLSGASGGSVGNAVFYALLDSATRNTEFIKSVDYRKAGSDFLRSDFLSSTLSHMLGPDYFRHIISLGLTVDRSAALEESMENPNDDHFMGGMFAKKYVEYINSFNNNKGNLPLFYINTTRVKDGSPGVIGNIQLSRRFTPRIDVLAMMDSVTPFGSINYSSAAILSARFPYISPAADIKHEYFVDGGYFDNSGAGIVLETISYLKGLMDSDPFYAPIRNRIEFRIIHVSNSQGGETLPSRMHPLVNDLVTPLITLAGSYGQQTNVNNDRLRKFIASYANVNCNDCWTTVNLYDVVNPADTTPFSMNWVISDTTLNRMDARVLANEKINKLIKTINGQ